VRIYDEDDGEGQQFGFWWGWIRVSNKFVWPVPIAWLVWMLNNSWSLDDICRTTLEGSTIEGSWNEAQGFCKWQCIQNEREGL